MFSNLNTETKVAVLQERISATETLLRKIDEAIQIMGKTHHDIGKMLAVHEQRLESYDDLHRYINKSIEEVKIETRNSINGIHESIEKMEGHIEEVSKIKWMTIGCGVVLAVLATVMSTLISGWWSPSDTHPSPSKSENSKIFNT